MYKHVLCIKTGVSVWFRPFSHLSFAGCVKKTDACWVHDFSHPRKYRDAGGQSYYVFLLFYRCPIPPGLSLVGPFANYVDRSSGDTNAFTIGDKAKEFRMMLTFSLTGCMGVYKLFSIVWRGPLPHVDIVFSVYMIRDYCCSLLQCLLWISCLQSLHAHNASR